MYAEASFIYGSKQSFTSLISLDILRPMRKLTTSIALLAALSLGNNAFADDVDTAAVKPAVETQSGIQRYATAAQELVIQGMSYLGIPYRYGGTDRESGVDCSGLVQNLFRSAIGLDLPRTAAAMSRVGEEVERSNSSRVIWCSSTPCAERSLTSASTSATGSFSTPRRPAAQYG